MAKYRYKVEDFLGHVTQYDLEADNDKLALAKIRLQRDEETKNFLNKLLSLFSPSIAYDLKRIEQEEITTHIGT